MKDFVHGADGSSRRAVQPPCRRRSARSRPCAQSVRRAALRRVNEDVQCVSALRIARSYRVFAAARTRGGPLTTRTTAPAGCVRAVPGDRTRGLEGELAPRCRAVRPREFFSRSAAASPTRDDCRCCRSPTMSTRCDALRPDRGTPCSASTAASRDVRPLLARNSARARGSPLLQLQRIPASDSCTARQQDFNRLGPRAVAAERGDHRSARAAAPTTPKWKAVPQRCPYAASCESLSRARAGTNLSSNHDRQSHTHLHPARRRRRDASRRYEPGRQDPPADRGLRHRRRAQRAARVDADARRSAGDVPRWLARIQNDLFDVGADIAVARGSDLGP